MPAARRPGVRPPIGRIVTCAIRGGDPPTCRSSRADVLRTTSSRSSPSHPRTSLSAVRASLTDEAEYGRWELARTRKYIGGGKKVWMRRRIIRVRSTLGQVGMPDA